MFNTEDTWLEKIFDFFKYNIFWPIERKIRYLKDRFWFRRHYQYTGLEPAWWDRDTVLLHTSFQILVDFVELECAYMNDWGEGEPFYRRIPILRNWFLPVRRPKQGIEYIERYQKYLDEGPGDDIVHWEKFDKPMYEGWAEWGKECLTLYHWWKDRENRPDPHDVSGWSDWCDKEREKYGTIFRTEPVYDENGKITCYRSIDGTPEEEAEKTKLVKKSYEIERAYYDEDTEMLHRLAKIRNGMWT
jgi:hypothetical protein